MMAKIQQDEALTTLLASRWEQASRKIEGLADVFPADEFDSRPLAGVRTFGEVLRHVAFWNQYVADSLRGRKMDDSANELPAADYSTKAKILDALMRASQDVASALRQCEVPRDGKVAELLMTFIEHTSEHYGQLVVYARLMGIVPPASHT
jgi:uncharacterized damage-inducible protein DinB